MNQYGFQEKSQELFLSSGEGHIDISYGDYTSLDCDFDLSGLPEIQNSFIYIGVNSLITNVKDIEKIEIQGQTHY